MQRSFPGIVKGVRTRTDLQTGVPIVPEPTPTSLHDLLRRYLTLYSSYMERVVKEQRRRTLKRKGGRGITIEHLPVVLSAVHTSHSRNHKLLPCCRPFLLCILQERRMHRQLGSVSAMLASPGKHPRLAMLIQGHHRPVRSD